MGLRRLDVGEAKGARVVAFPYAGGGAHSYQPLAVALDEAELWAAEYPGHITRFGEPLVEDLVDLAASFVKDVTALADRPLVLFGYSMGAVVAFELAHRLAGTAELRGLIVCCARAPTRPPRDGQSIDDMDDRRLLEHVASQGGMPDAVLQNRELLELVLPVLRADFLACERYVCRHTSPLPMSLIALRGSRDADVSAADLDEWSRFSTVPLEHIVLEGGHFLLHEPQAGLPSAVRSAVTSALSS